MLRRTPLALIWIVAASSLASAACEGTGGAVLRRSGPRQDAGPRPVDAHIPERDRPSVIGTEPGQGATGIARDVTVRIELSEPMDPRAGTLRMDADGTEVAADVRWNLTRTELTLEPREPLPSEARVRVVLEADFADRSGNTLALPFELGFDIGDRSAPIVLSSAPSQGAHDVRARLDAITIEFDELMNASTGVARLEGATGTLGDIEWIDGDAIRIPVSGLAHGATYRLFLEGFEDTSGNALDPSVYLRDGAIELTTGADADAPHVLDSIPSEGQVNVALRGTPSVVFVFDEPMDPTAGAATLHAGGLAVPLAGVWSDEARTLTLPIAGRLYPAAPHAIELAGMRDAAGNALDPIRRLGDGRLDFHTGADATVPIVVFSYPSEGSSDADHRLDTIELAFDRAMDSSITSLRIDDGAAPFDAAISWNLAGTRARIDVRDRIHAGRSVRVDARAMTDVAGDRVDAAHPYLGNGVLDFTTRAPTGEQCRDELTVAQATPTAGGFEWTIGETSMSIADNGPVCAHGATLTSYSPDAVILYRKTTASGSAAGRYLHVSVQGPNAAQRTAFAVYRDVCGQALPGGPTARVACQSNRWRWEQFLDVGAGDYYVWVASTDSSTQDRLTVRIEEVDEVPIGESCARPYTADVTLPVYAPPSSPGGEHTWTIPAQAYRAADMGEPGDGAATCDPDQAQGTDFVVRFDKARADSLVSVVVEGGDTGFVEVNAEALSRCDPRLPGVVSYACEAEMRPGTSERHGARRMTFDAPAGPFHVWVANQLQQSDSLAASVRIQEIERAGSSCADAIPIAGAGRVALTTSSLARLDVPSCMRPDAATGDGRQTDGITWYRLTTTDVATMIRTDAAGTPDNVGAIALVDATSGRELACTRDATSIPATALLAPGSEVCVAVRGTSGITELSVSSMPYAGVMGRPTPLAIARPLDSSGQERTITGDLWMAATPTTLQLAVPSGLVIAPRSGGARASFRALGSTQVGSSGLAIGEAIWSLDDSSTAGAGARLWQLADAVGAAIEMPWDADTVWPADAFDALTYDGSSFYVVNDWAASVPPAIHRFDATAPDRATVLDELGPGARDTLGLAADATWFFFAASWEVDATTTLRGVFRVLRIELGNTTPELIASLPIVTRTEPSVLHVARVPMFVDRTTAAQMLYVRDADGSVHAIVDPGGDPVHLGPISPLGERGDSAMAYDASGPSIYLFETTTSSGGNFTRLD